MDGPKTTPDGAISGSPGSRAGDDPARWRDQAYPGDYQGQIQQAIGFAGIEHDFFVAGKARWLAGFMRQFGFRADSSSLLDVGCGIGLLHRYLSGLDGQIVGIDVSADAISEAQRRNPGVAYQRYDGTELPFEGGRFDLALAITVLHHVPVAQWQAFVAEAHRILKPRGAFIVIEHNPFNPLTRYVVNRCEIDADAVLLRAGQVGELMRGAGFQRINRDYIFFTPFKSQMIQALERRIGWLPLGAQYAAYGFKGG